MNETMTQSTWKCAGCGRDYKSPIKGTVAVGHNCPKDNKGRKFRKVT